MTIVKIIVKNELIGTLRIDSTLTDGELGEIVNESGGFADLAGMAVESTLPDDYEWTGSEEYDVAESEPVFAAYIDGIIWGIGNSEEHAIADGTDWLSRNGDIEDAQYLKADECDQDLADAVTNRGGQVRWEWAQHPGHRHMQLRRDF